MKMKKLFKNGWNVINNDIGLKFKVESTPKNQRLRKCHEDTKTPRFTKNRYSEL